MANLEGDPRVWFWPTDENDPDKVPLRRRDGRYSVMTDDAGESPVGPALYIHTEKVLETKWDKKKDPARQAAPAQN